MATLYPFAQPDDAPFAFSPVLDGTTYNITVTWNLYGQRYYLNIYRLDGTLVTTLPRIASPSDRDINITQGYFTTSTLIWRPSTGNFEVSP